MTLWQVRENLGIECIIQGNTLFILKDDKKKVFDYCNEKGISCTIKLVNSF